MNRLRQRDERVRITQPPIDHQMNCLVCSVVTLPPSRSATHGDSREHQLTRAWDVGPKLDLQVQAHYADRIDGLNPAVKFGTYK